MSAIRGRLSASAMCVAPVVLLLVASARVAFAQAPAAATEPWSGGIELGAGHLGLTTDQGRAVDAATFVLGFRVSRALGDRLRVGVDLGGWLIEANDVNDPAEGESVSSAGAHLQLFPFRARPIFVEGGLGRTVYTNHAPLEFNTHGLGWTAGVGYAVPSRRSFWWSIGLHTSGGHLRDIDNILVTETGWRWSATDVRLGGGLRFGRPRH